MQFLVVSLIYTITVCSVTMGQGYISLSDLDVQICVCLTMSGAMSTKAQAAVAQVVEQLYTDPKVCGCMPMCPWARCLMCLPKGECEDKAN